MSIADCTNDFAWNNKYLREDSKPKIYNSRISPALTFGAEARSQTKSQMQVTEMGILKIIVENVK